MAYGYKFQEAKTKTETKQRDKFQNNTSFTNICFIHKISPKLTLYLHHVKGKWTEVTNRTRKFWKEVVTPINGPLKVGANNLN